MDGARTKLEREAKDRIQLAWQIANLTRAAKMPSLEKLLSEVGKVKEATTDWNHVKAGLDAIRAGLKRKKRENVA